jgi:hypothetical protein
MIYVERKIRNVSGAIHKKERRKSPCAPVKPSTERESKEEGSCFRGQAQKQAVKQLNLANKKT